MAIQYDIQVDGDILRVKTSGFDESLEEAQAYAFAILSAAGEHQVTKVICDETDLKYSLGTVDLYEMATALAKAAPRVIRAALIYHPDQFSDVRFWETVALNCGGQIKIFKDPAVAEEWIQDG